MITFFLVLRIVRGQSERVERISLQLPLQDGLRGLKYGQVRKQTHSLQLHWSSAGDGAGPAGRFAVLQLRKRMRLSHE